MLAYRVVSEPKCAGEEGYWSVCSLPGYADGQFCSRVIYEDQARRPKQPAANAGAEAILGVEAVRELLDLTPPHIPCNPSLCPGFQAKIVRPTGVQTIGWRCARYQ
jgi:hypothetical protein